MKASEISDRRNNLGWSQEKLADKSSLSFSAISKIEQGIRNPTARTLRDIEKALKEGERKRQASRKKSGGG